MLAIKEGAPSLFLAIIEAANTKAPDKYTVTFRLKELSAIFLAAVRSWVSATGAMSRHGPHFKDRSCGHPAPVRHRALQRKPVDQAGLARPSIARQTSKRPAP